MSLMPGSVCLLERRVGARPLVVFALGLRNALPRDGLILPIRLRPSWGVRADANGSPVTPEHSLPPQTALALQGFGHGPFQGLQRLCFEFPCVCHFRLQVSNMFSISGVVGVRWAPC